MTDTQTVRSSITQVVDDLPALASVLHEVMAALESPDTGAEDIARLIERDAAISAKVLRLANSAFFGYERDVSSVLQAVILIGLRQVGYLNLSLSVNAELARVARHLDTERFSKHSLACGVVSRAIGQELGLRDLDKAFVIGMLHDIGQIVLGVAQPDRWRIIAEGRHEGESRQDAEVRLFGLDHGRAGALLAEKWGLPQDICDDISNHHHPVPGSGATTLREVVTVADGVCHLLGFPSLGPCHSDDVVSRMAKQAMSRLDSEAIRASVAAALDY